jgi:hypothetical protein
MKTMPHRQQAILINVAIFAVLIFEFLRGRTMGVLAISAVVLFLVANLALLMAAKNKGRNRRTS